MIREVRFNARNREPRELEQFRVTQSARERAKQRARLRAVQRRIQSGWAREGNRAASPGRVGRGGSREGAPARIGPNDRARIAVGEKKRAPAA